MLFKWIIDKFMIRNNNDLTKKYNENIEDFNSLNNKYINIVNKYNMTVVDYGTLNDKYNELVKKHKSDIDDYNSLLKDARNTTDDYNELISFAKEMENFINNYITVSTDTFGKMIAEFEKFNNLRSNISLNKLFIRYKTEYESFVKMKIDMKNKLKAIADKLEQEENDDEKTI